MITIPQATCLSKISLSLHEGRLSCQAQLYRCPTSGAYVAILCVGADDTRSVDRIAELAAEAARYYRPLAPAAAIIWLLHLPSRQAPESCGGVHCPEIWERLSLGWNGSRCTNQRKRLDHPRLMERDSVEELVGGAL